MLKILLLLGKHNSFQGKQILLFLVTETTRIPRFRAHVPLSSYRNSSHSPISGTCSPFLLPKLFTFIVFGHMFPFLLTETLHIHRFRAHVPLSCYRNSSHSSFSGTCSPFLLPKLFTFIVFGHMFPFLVTETFYILPFRAHVPLYVSLHIAVSFFPVMILFYR
jgi:hypothetical protein